ncbi:acyltransferase [Microlunatus ginsengisoli]|uniref:Acyltransferase n=1 Tax=Microlunatus ginsengisoli TaxID=363863 RepID=A0ABP7AJX4_9ACTN
MVFHIVISDASAGRVYKLDHNAPMSTWAYALNYTPLRVAWAGSEAVVVFYVLSGFVLALPFARSRGPSWRVFYPRRLIRLYVPAIASLIFAWITTLIVHRRIISGGSPWLNHHASEPTGPMQILLGSSLMAGWGGLNTSLWSLRWEVMFSLLLPIFLILAAWCSRWDLGKAVVVLLFCAAWPLVGWFYPDLVYISVFSLGVLMAYNLDALSNAASRIPPFAWGIVVTASIVLLTNSWIVAGVDLNNPARRAWIAIASIGAAGLVWVAIGCRAARRLLSHRSIAWLGGISFSLYLTQEPVVVGLAFVSGGRIPLWLEVPLAFVAAVLVGWIFYRLVERPSHRFARAWGSKRRSAAAGLQQSSAPSRTAVPMPGSEAT